MNVKLSGQPFSEQQHVCWNCALDKFHFVNPAILFLESAASCFTFTLARSIDSVNQATKTPYYPGTKPRTFFDGPFSWEGIRLFLSAR